jgi:choline dehydrogenase-like flavoprotein
MIEKIDTETLVVGSGFAGTAVAAQLTPGSFLLVDRGEPLDYSQALRTYRQFSSQASSPQSDFFQKLLQATQSKIDNNRLSEKFSTLSSNLYTFIAGGISNLWGGYCNRITSETFDREGVLTWPIKLADLELYYQQAEKLLLLHGDPDLATEFISAPIPGYDLWRDILGPYFPNAHVGAYAKNVSRKNQGVMGACDGSGFCLLCPNDGKVRPNHLFPLLETYCRTFIKEIVFDGASASYAVCETDGEIYHIGFKQIVIAAGGLENVGILKRGNWPKQTPVHLAGLCFQDHAVSSTYLELPIDLPFLQIGAESHIELPSLSGYFNNIEFKTLAITAPAVNEAFNFWLSNQQEISQSRIAEFISQASKYLNIWTQIEIPPEFEMELIYGQQNNYAFSDERYLANITELERAYNLFLKKVNNHKVKVIGSDKFFQKHYGGQHYTGTTPMSTNHRAVVDLNLKVLGTDNVYIVGGSVLPRTGAASPTLSIIALALRLAQHLRGTEAS